VILPVVLYGCETRPLTLREEHSLRVFENRILRGIFGTKREEVIGSWRKLLMRRLMLCSFYKIFITIITGKTALFET
jgi:hypothetical protein